MSKHTAQILLGMAILTSGATAWTPITFHAKTKALHKASGHPLNKVTSLRGMAYAPRLDGTWWLVATTTVKTSKGYFRDSIVGVSIDERRPGQKKVFDLGNRHVAKQLANPHGLAVFPGISHQMLVASTAEHCLKLITLRKGASPTISNLQESVE